MAKRYNLMMDVTVGNIETLYDAAQAKYLAENPKGTIEEAKDLLMPDGLVCVAACIQMMLDPGHTDGVLEIDTCTVEAY
ncbi:hypothetical protein ACODYM_28985 [Burkholderia gladioli]|uniref:hypothetical protein n=1 Tax=Burkholderia gladioli TaxID=28095 RepID=UPI003B50B980